MGDWKAWHRLLHAKALHALDEAETCHLQLEEAQAAKGKKDEGMEAAAACMGAMRSNKLN